MNSGNPTEKDPKILPWSVAYTKPRNEKQVHLRLLQLGYETYCPLSRIKRKWSDRVKWVEEPVFRSYVFVRIPREDMGKARNIPGMLTFLFHEGKPAVIRESEIELIRSFLRDHTGVTARPLTDKKPAPEVGQTVLINEGILMGQEGKVVRVKNREITVAIQSLGQELVATLDPDLIQ
jgi:transcription antitermination factor NusG